jgi:hypothetical protein
MMAYTGQTRTKLGQLCALPSLIGIVLFWSLFFVYYYYYSQKDQPKASVGDTGRVAKEVIPLNSL